MPHCAPLPSPAPVPAWQASIPPHPHPAADPSPPRRSHQTGLKVNNSLPRARSRIRAGTAQMGSAGWERATGKASRPMRDRGGNADGTHGQGRVTGTCSLPGAMPKSTGLLQPRFTFPRCPFLPCALRPRRLRRSLPRCSELAASPRRVPSCPVCLQGTQGALEMAAVPVTAGTWHHARANPGDGLGTRPCRFFSMHGSAVLQAAPNPAPARGALARQCQGAADPPAGMETDPAMWDRGRRWERSCQTGLGLPPKWGWGDNQQQNGRSRPCLLVTGRLPSGHGTACRSRALEAAACPGHPQITSSPAPAPLQEQEGAPGRAQPS